MEYENVFDLWNRYNIKKGYTFTPYVEVEKETKDCIYAFEVPGYSKDEIDVKFYDGDKDGEIVIRCKNDTSDKTIKRYVTFDVEDITAKLEYGILYLTVKEYVDVPWEIEID